MATPTTQLDLSGTVVIYPIRSHVPTHERTVHQALATSIATLLDRRYVEGAADAKPTLSASGAYLIPTATVVGTARADDLGITDENDLFGAVVPHAFVATKAISHALPDSDSPAPEGWSTEFTDAVAQATLRGYTVFDAAEALEAGRRLLAHGPLRIKPVQATGGRGQVLVRDEAALKQALADLDCADVPTCGLGLESHLEDVTTYSVGQVRIGGLVASYWGTQRLTPDNKGEEVYGGSDLHVVRGDFARLLELDVEPRVRTAIEQAKIYDDAASRCFPGLIASRRNYDIAHGFDAEGKSCSGVLEQSWRIGGASSAEVAALQMFRHDPGLHAVSTSSVEVYGEGRQVPPGATLMYRGKDEDVGFITKYVMAGAYGNAQ